MADIVISGNTSGSVTLRAPDIAGSPILTLPTTTGTLVVTGGAQTVQFAAGSAAAPSITFTGDTNTGIFSPAADTIAFSEGGVESMRIDSAGNVGIGTSTPSSKLQVNGIVTAPYYKIPSGTGFNAFEMGADAAGPGWYVYDNTTSTYRIFVNNAGNVKVQNNISVGGATPTTSGSGITFPASQNASSDANTLDDYEEGTYTATLTPATSGSITIDNSYKTLSYVKIGRAVHVTGYLYIASVSSPTGANVVLNLPFNVANGEQFQSSASISTNQLGSSKAANITWNFVQLNDNKCLMYDGSINGVGSGAYATYIQAGTDFRVQITYFTS